MTAPVMDATAVLLTDDEVLALSAFIQKPWPTPLPTIDVTDADEAQASVARGWRSLNVRGLVADGVPDVTALAVTLLAFECSILARTFLSESAFTPSARGALTTFLEPPSDAGAVMIVASPTGVHAVGCIPAGRARVLLSEAASAANRTGLGAEPDAALSLCLVGAGHATAALSIQRGSVTRYAPDGNDGLTTESLGDDLSEPLKTFLDSVFPET